MAERELALRTLSAPIAGTITELELDVGEWVNASDAAMRLVDASECIVRVSVEEGLAQDLRTGIRLPVRVEHHLGAVRSKASSRSYLQSLSGEWPGHGPRRPR